MTRSSLGAEVVELLEEGGHIQAAEDLDSWLQLLESSDPDEKSRAALEIGQRCNVRWLGDLSVNAPTLQSWWGKLEALARAAKRQAASSF